MSEWWLLLLIPLSYVLNWFFLRWLHRVEPIPFDKSTIGFVWVFSPATILMISGIAFAKFVDTLDLGSWIAGKGSN